MSEYSWSLIEQTTTIKVVKKIILTFGNFKIHGEAKSATLTKYEYIAQFAMRELDDKKINDPNFFSNTISFD